MRIFKFIIIIALLLGAASPQQAHAAVADSQEDICGDAAVVWCDNFEDRTVNLNTDLWRTKYKNYGWGVSNFNCVGVSCSSVVTAPSGTPAYLGSKVLRMVTPVGFSSGGFFDAGFNGTRNEIYFRKYTMWCGTSVCADDYIWSPIATKGISFETQAGTNSALWWFDAGQSAIPKQFWYFTSGATCGTYIRCQNANLPAQSVNLNQWYCLELRVKMNTGTGNADGIMEGWIDGVKKFDFQNEAIETSAYPNGITGVGVYSYWNCQNESDCTGTGEVHPEIYRFEDNMVASTARIGCLSGSAPAAPTNFKAANPT